MGWHRTDWEDLADLDALWAILSRPDRRFGRWDVAEFFATGAREIESVMTTTARLGYPTVRERALDFGCGVGRLTRAMARFFDEVVGVDISAGMIARARELNHDVTNCQFVDLPEGDLRMFPAHQFDIAMNYLARREVMELLESLGARVLEVRAIASQSNVYYVTK